MKRKSRDNKNSRFQLEMLEPRLLFSADFTGVFASDVGDDRDFQDDGIDALPKALPLAIAQQYEQPRHELVVVDTRAPDYELLLQDIHAQQTSGRTLDVLLLDQERDGIAQISEALEAYDDLDAIHIVSHADAGAVQLGAGWLDTSTLNAASNSISQWSDALDEGADLLFYGCDLAADDAGVAMLRSLSGLTGADVAASDDRTGAYELGGDWVLEYVTGEVEAELAFSFSLQARFENVLAVNTAPAFGNLDAVTNYTENQIDFVLDTDVSVNDAELDAFNGGAGDYHGAVLQLVRDGGRDSEDIFGFVDGNGISLVGDELFKNAQVIASFDTSKSGELELEFTNANTEMPTTADVSAIVSQITYSNSSDLPPASVDLEWSLDDGNKNAQGTGGKQSVVAVQTVNVTASNDSPYIVGLDAAHSYTEGDGALVLDSSLSVGDPELDALAGGNANYAGMVVTLGRAGGPNAEDVFGFDSGGGEFLVGNQLEDGDGPLGIWDTSTPGQLTITFTEDNGNFADSGHFSHYLQRITYQNTGSLPTGGIQIEWTIADGNTGSQGTGGVGSVTGSVGITTLGFNEAPVLGNLDSVVTLIENSGGVALHAAVDVADIELDSYDAGLGNYAGAQFSIARSGVADAEDLFGFTAGNGITLVGNELHKAGVAIATFDTSTAGELVVSYIDANGQKPTSADVDAIHRQISYDNANNLPQASVQLDWSFNDGNAATEQGNGGLGNTLGTTTVAIIPRNDAPVFNNLDATPTYAEAGVRVLLDTDVSITDAETDTRNGGNGDYDRAVLTLARNGAPEAEDVFGFVDGNGITLSGGNLIKNALVIGSFDTAIAGQLTVTFTSANGEIPTTADVTTVARQITYLNTSDAAATSVQIDWSMQDAVDTDWWNHGWSDRMELTFNNLASAEDLDDFPVLLRLTAADVDFGLIGDGGADLRFVDGDGTLLQYEIDSWDDTAETASVWVRVPTIDQASATDSIYMYYGNPSASSVSVPANVWASSHVGVWHLGETVNDEQSGAVHVDAASAHNGIQNNNDDTPGQIGNAQAFDNDSDVIEIADSDSLSFTDGLNDQAFSISAWISPDSDDGVIFGKGSTDWEYELFIETDKLSLALYDANDDYIGMYAVDDFSYGSWQHVAATYDGSGASAGVKIYVDGIEQSTSVWTNNDYDGMSNTAELARIGSIDDTGDIWDFDGKIDEVRLSNSVRSADWVEASWLSQRSGASFVGFGVAERSQDAGGVATGTGSITVAIATVNDDPVLNGLNASPTFTEGLAAVVLDSTVSIADVELDSLNGGNGDYSGASLALSRTVTANSEDVFSFVAGNGISQSGSDLLKNGQAIASFDISTAGELLLTFTNVNGEVPTTADVNAIAGQIAYSNSGDAPPASVQVDWVFNDGNVLAQGSGGALVDSGNITVLITGVNDGPTFTSLDANETFLEYPAPFVSAPVQFDKDVSISDPELDALNGGLGNYAGATLTIARDGGKNSEDYFFILTDNGITFDGTNLNKAGSALASFDRSVAGQLTITFNTSTTAEVNDVLRQTSYGNSSEFAPASVDMELTFNDGNLLAQGQGNDLATSGVVTINIRNWNETPELSGLDGSPVFVEDNSAIVMDNSVAISDVELDIANSGNGDYSGAILKLARAGAANGDDVFGFVDGNGITLVGGSLIKNGQAIASFDTSITGELSVIFTNANGEIPTTADASTIAGQLTYSNSSNLPPAGVQIDWEFDDGVAPGWNAAGQSNVVGSVNVAITSINEGPTLNGLDATPTYTEDQPGVVLDNAVVIADPELDTLNSGSGDYHGASLTLVSDLAASGDDVFGLNAGNGISLVGANLIKNGQAIASFDTSVQGQLTITYTNANGETPTSADVNAIAQQLTYINSSDLPPAEANISWTFSDGNVTGQGLGGVLTANSSMSVTLVGINEAPGFINLDATPTFVEGGSVVVLDSDVVLVDKELDARNAGNGNYSGATLTLARSGGANIEDVFGFNDGSGISLVGANLLKNGEVIASFDTSTAGQVVITFTHTNGEIPTTADASAIARQLTYGNTSEAPATSVSIDWTLDDGAAPEWLHSGWEDRVEITLDNLASATDLQNFPVLIRLTAADVDFSKIAANGADLRFTDANGDDLFYEIDSWDDVTETGAVWVKVTQLDQASDTNLIYMYHNNPGAADGQNAAQVWPDSIGVWHLDEDPGPGLAGEILDSAGTANDGTAGAPQTSGDSLVGNVGDAIKFDADGEYVGFGTTNFGQSFTIEAWIKPVSGNADSMTIVANSAIGANTDGFRFFLRGESGGLEDGQLRFETGSGGDSRSEVSLPGLINFDQWNHVAVEVDRATGEVRLYHNGVDVSEDNTVLDDFMFNSDFDIGQMEGGGFEFVGSIDEVRIANVGRSADWIEASYLSQSSGFAFAALGDKLTYTDFADNKSVTQASTVNIAGVNDQPGMVGLDATPTFIEDQTAVVLDSSVTISDLELDSLNGGAGDYNGASLALARDITANSDDVFGFNAGNGISLVGGELIKNGQAIAGFDTSAAGELTITYTNANGETPTTADVNAIARQLTYSNSNDQPPTSVQINWDLSDGNVTAQGSGGALGASGSITVAITSANENPTFTGLDATPTFTEDQSAVVLDGNVVISDPELDSHNSGNGDYSGASLTLGRNIAASAEDVFGFNTGNGISLLGGELIKNGQAIASFNTSVAGVLTITYTNVNVEIPTTADVNAIARQLTYSNSSDLPPASVQINWDLSDGNVMAQGAGGVLGASGSITVGITSVNENPTLTGLDNTPTFVEDQVAVVLDSNTTIADVELDTLNGGAGDYSGASLTLARNITADAEDVFGFNSGNGISLVGGDLMKNSQVIASFDTSTAGELTITYTNANGETPTTADVNSIARQLTYSNSSDLPPAAVQINWDLSDGNGTAQGTGGALGASGSISVGITSVNENPNFIGLDATPNFIENQPAVVLDSNVTITDPELDSLNSGNGDFSGASLTLARNITANAEDVFGFNSGNGISLVGGNLIKNSQVIASFDTSAAGELTITYTNVNGETPTTADVNAIARQLTYSNSSDLPPAAVQINWDLSDGNGTAQGAGGALGVSGSITVGITSVNENPTLSGLDNAPTFIEDQVTVVLDNNVTITDAELDSLNNSNGDYSGASLTLARNLAANAEDVFGFNTGNGISLVGGNLIKNSQVIASFDTGAAGELTITYTSANGETPTTADVNAIARQLTYSNSSDLPPASVQINWDLSDGNGTAQGTGGALGVSGSITVGITSVNENPTLTGLDNTPTFIEDQSAILLDNTVTITDAELDGLNGGAGDYHGASLTLARNLAANAEDVFGFNAGNGISLVGGNLIKNSQVIASFDTSAAGELTITYTNANGETPTTADVNAIARQLTYSNSSDLPPANVQINWDLSDGNSTAQGTGGALGASGSITVGITSVNENPTLTGVDNTPTFVEDQSAVVLDNSVTITDAELDGLNGGAGDYSGASLTLARNLAANAEDVFGFNTGNGISLVGSNLIKNSQVIASFDTSAAGELTITYTDANGETPTTADVNAIARQLTYSNNSDLPPANVQINWDLSDGNGTAQGTGGALGASGSITVGITSVNENPTLTGLDNTPTFIEDQSAVILDGNVVIADVELDSLNAGNGDYSGASLTLARNIAANAEDVFGFNSGNGISLVGGNLIKNSQVIASFDTSTAGELTITYTNANGETPTTADVNAIARQLTYSNSSDLPPANVQINWDLTDGNGTAQGTGGALNASGSITVGITSVNENSTLTGLDNTPTFIEDQSTVVLDGTVTIADVELDSLNSGNGDYSGASLTLARNVAANVDDVFGFNTGNGISLVGGNLIKNSQVIASFDTSAVGELTITYTNANGETPTTADVNAIARQLTYSNSSDLPPANVQINWDLSDGNGTAQGTGGALGASGSITVGITSVNENPTLTGLDNTPTFIEDQSAVVLDNSVTITDAELDSLNGGAGDYNGASLTLARNLAANAEDVFGFNPGNGISLVGGNLIKNSQVIASFDTSTAGELTITYTNANGETPTTTDVNAIARQLTYSNSSDLPPANVQINWDLSDGNVTAQGTGGALGASGSINVGITSVNENPTFAGLDNTPTFIEDQSAVVLDGTVTIADVELDSLNGGAGDYSGASLTLARNLTANAEDVFGFNTGNGISLVGGNLIKNSQVIASFDTSAAGELTITYTNANGETPTTADVNAIARQLTYSNSSDLPPANVQINWDLSDGNGIAQGTGGALGASGSINVGITSVNEDPTLTGLDNTPTFLEDQSAVLLDNTVTITDAELDSLNGGAGDYSGASLTLARNVAANAEDVFGFNPGNGISLVGSNLIKNSQVIASFDTSTAGELTIVYTNANGETPTTTDVNAIARQLTYSNSSDLPPASVQINWDLSDGNVTAQGTGGALGASGSINVGITSVNENPTFAGLDATPTFIENQSAVVLDGNVIIADAELDSLNGGNGDYSGASLILARDLAANAEDVFGFNAGNGISLVGSTLVKNGQAIASFDTSAAGELTITYTNANGETPTTADVNAIARQLTYSNNSDLPPASVQINWSLSDGNATAQGAGGVLGASGSMNVGITSVNENPTLTGLDNTPTYIEDQSAVVMDNNVTIADAELDSLNSGAGDYSGANLTLARNIAANAEDVFGFNPGNGISLVGGNLIKNSQIIASFDTSAAGELTITYTNANGETPTTADVNAIARQLTYSNSSDLPPANVQISWDMSDGNGTAQGTGGALSASGLMTVGITSVNENPTLTGLDNTPTFIEDQLAVVLDNNVTITDVELDSLNAGNGDYSGASLTLARNLTANAEDVFGFSAGNGISLVGGNLIKNSQVIASFDTSTAGELTITYTNANGETPTTADVNAIARQLTYSNNSDLPPANVQINWDLSDGNGTAQGTGGVLGASGSINVSITSVNENPTLTGLNNTPTYIEDQSAVVMDNNVTITDAELDGLNSGAGDYSGATLTLARNITANAEDVFGFSAGNGISLVGGNLIKNGQSIASFDTSTAGELTITYTNANGETPTTADVNAIARQLTYSNSSELPPANVQINWDLNDANGTAQGTGGALGASGSINIGITSVNEAPTFTGLDANPVFTEDQPAVVLDNNVTLSDPELDSLNGGNGDYAGASLTLARSSAVNSEDVFGFENGNGISLVSGNLIKNSQVIASFDTSFPGELNIIYTNVNGEVPTSADVNVIQRQITYSNSSDLPPASVDIDWDFADGNGGDQGIGGMLAAGGTISVNISSVNDAPVVSGLDTRVFIENGAAIVLDSDVVIADLELAIIGDHAGASLTLVRSGAANSDDVFSFNSGNGISLLGNQLLKNGQAIASFDTTVDGQLTVTFASASGEVPTGADVNTVARQLTYLNTSDLPPADVQIEWTFDDGNVGAQGGGLAKADTVAQTINIGSVNEAPAIIGLDAIAAFTEDQAAVILDADMRLEDRELDSLGGGAGNYDGASLVLVRSAGANAEDSFGFSDTGAVTRVGDALVKGGAVIADFDTSTAGQLTLRFLDSNGQTPTSADVEAIVQNLTYSSNSEMPQPLVQLEWQFNDGNSGAQGSGGAAEVIGSSQVRITAVDDTAPVQTANTGSDLEVGTTDLLSITELRYTDSEQGSASITYNITSVTSSGFLARAGDSQTSITQFTQAEVDAGDVVYVHTGVGTEFDSFAFTVTDGQGNTSAIDTFGIDISVADTQTEVLGQPRGPGDPLPIVDLEMVDNGFSPIDVAEPPFEEYNRKGGFFEDTPVAEHIEPDTEYESEAMRSESTVIQRFSGAVAEEVVLDGSEHAVGTLNVLEARSDTSLVRNLETDRHGFSDIANYALTQQQQAQNEPQTAAETLLFALDDMREQLESSLAEQYNNELLLSGSARMAGVTLSAGYLAWLLRAGPMLASVAASVPTWARFDPLPVVLKPQDKAEKQRRADEPTDELDAQQEEAATYLLDNASDKAHSGLMESRDS